MIGWAVNLTEPGAAELVDFPVQPLFAAANGRGHPTNEVVFWSPLATRWVHIVAASFVRDLPAGHVQATVGDLAWIEKVVARSGVEGLRGCVAELEADMVPESEA